MRLTALRANNPVAVMAAYGVLRLLPEARLRWRDVHPELECEGDPVARLAALLPARLAAPEHTRLDDPRDNNIGGVEGFRHLSEEIPSEWLAAYAAECADGVRDTGLLLLGGRHRFVANARDVMAALARRDDVGVAIQEALFGPWRYADKVIAWGWDAAARIDPAASPRDVSSTPKFGVAGAYWLAWESLPLWPMVNGRTVGMSPREWRYPVCAEWVGCETLRALILGGEQLAHREREALGVTYWSAALLSGGKFGKVLGWAHPAGART
ncbi:type I-G CRISPR-associated protein, Cas3-extension family [Marichromatium bheemlicum]|uniref:Uncharacterized protein n=1 Tax=Marichromatium bheemlicum TaxID=365339 RepID=A0ABX1IB28_9GAMM|nr:hypothetical protein [Marichromatium bheemlicum]NKN34396.1 hypothetical protein [Marichromatium bheemlicum]